MIFGWFNNTRQHLSEEDLSAYVDGRPDAPSEDRVRQHLAICDATCDADLEALRPTVAILSSIAPVTAPRSFALTAAMVADLPDGKPLGEPPVSAALARSARTGGWRMPVLVPAAASIAAAVVFALVLVGNLSGVVEQSRSSSNDAMSIAAGIGGDLEMTVESEMAAAVPLAGDAVIAEAQGIPAPDERVTSAAAPVAPEMATQSDSALVAPAEPETAPSLAAPPAPESALPLAPKAAPDIANLETAPEIESAEDAAADGSEVLELPRTELFDTDAASTASALESLPVEAIAQIESQVLPGSLGAPVISVDDDFTLPVWQLLLATGIITALLAGVSLQLSRRNIPG